MAITYREHIDALAPLETFDAHVFVGDEEWPQDVCNFILALAVIYDDFKDVIVAHHGLDAVVPSQDQVLAPEVGMHNALRISVMRLNAGILRELFDLIDRSPAVLTNESLVRVTSALSRDGRDAWKVLTEVAKGRMPKDPEGRALFFVRNKVAFHYDAKAIACGYRKAFLESAGEEPLLSRGRTMQGTRFYFADAAVQRYLTENSERSNLMEVLTGKSRLVHCVNQALHEVVTKFIQARSPWSSPRGKVAG